MNYLIDTCVISELRKPAPQESVLAWFDACREESLYTSSLNIGELQFGLAMLPAGKKKNDLLIWFAQVIEAFSGRILPVTDVVSLVWGNMRAKAQKNGKTLPVIDGLLAATAEAYDLVFVTRNTVDVEITDIQTFNPWLE